MDLAVGAKRVLVMTTHTTRDGRPKLMTACTYPLTAATVVDRVYTDLAVLDVVPDGFLVRELVAGVSREQLRSLTAADLRFADDLGVLRPS
jgi:3-oxoacid CoA-transferase B subunit